MSSILNLLLGLLRRDVIKITVSVDDKATLERKKRVEKLMDELF